jgi:CarD family transcriptional regulator
MFKVDDLIIYDGTGVCRVEAISQVDFVEDDGQYYVLRPLYKNGTIYTPVEGNRVYMRTVMSREEALHLIDRIPAVDADVYKSNSIQQLSKHYQAVIETHDMEALIGLTKSLHRKSADAGRQNRHLGQIDRKYMKRAEDLLFGELAAALDIPKDDVTDFIFTRVGETDI